ncbi:hypothetical protein IKS57_00530, partial [bacterium]|nr:hypothetical protein [bacterium]
MSNNPKQQGNLHFTLLANNIGPLNDLKYSLDSKNTKKIYCIYANNASGKTFISRCFSLCNLEKDENTLNYLSKNLITFNENSSKFEFCLSTDKTKKLTIKLDKNKGIITKTNNTGYIFHVFNEDFIDKNIGNEIDKFHNSIKGSYIIGEEAININNLKKTLNTLEEEKYQI